MKNSQTITKEVFGVFTPSERANIPELPGVYIYKNAQGDILYIGKAKNLHKRVASYFSKKPIYLKTFLLVEQIKLIDIIVVENEREALLLEATLIKKHMPRFNINFKDGKFYPYIKALVKEKFPRLIMTRSHIDDGNLYFGPYTSAGAVRTNLEVLQKIFKLRTCRTLPKKECMEYHIGRCSAPCIGKINEKEYLEAFEGALKFLSGDKQELIESLQEKMKNAARELLFEKAQIYKEQLDAIYALDEKQHIYLSDGGNLDIIGLSSKNGHYSITVSLIRNGKLTGKLGFTAHALNKNLILNDPSLILEEFIANRYSEEEVIPYGIIVNKDFTEAAEQLTEWFSENEISLTVRPPENDNENALLKLAEKNAVIHLEQQLSEPDMLEALHLLQKELNLKNMPGSIEGFDIAKWDGTLASGVSVHFKAGEPDKKQYRFFNIKASNQQDDYIAMKEIISRRLKQLLEENKPLPQLLVVDGGKGQLKAGLEALKELSITNVDILALAKKEEEIFLPGKKQSVILPKNSIALHLLQRVRDEAHRFSQYQLHRRYQKKIME